VWSFRWLTGLPNPLSRIREQAASSPRNEPMKVDATNPRRRPTVGFRRCPSVRGGKRAPAMDPLQDEQAGGPQQVGASPHADLMTTNGCRPHLGGRGGRDPQRKRRSGGSSACADWCAEPCGERCVGQLCGLRTSHSSYGCTVCVTSRLQRRTSRSRAAASRLPQTPIRSR
jgi:hypothetical protein